jgi:hypothetical protein
VHLYSSVAASLLQVCKQAACRRVLSTVVRCMHRSVPDSIDARLMVTRAITVSTKRVNRKRQVRSHVIADSPTFLCLATRVSSDLANRLCLCSVDDGRSIEGLSARHLYRAPPSERTTPTVSTFAQTGALWFSFTFVIDYVRCR